MQKIGYFMVLLFGLKLNISGTLTYNTFLGVIWWEKKGD